MRLMYALESSSMADARIMTLIDLNFYVFCTLLYPIRIFVVLETGLFAEFGILRIFRFAGSES